MDIQTLTTPLQHELNPTLTVPNLIAALGKATYLQLLLASKDATLQCKT